LLFASNCGARYHDFKDRLYSSFRMVQTLILIIVQICVQNVKENFDAVSFVFMDLLNVMRRENQKNGNFFFPSLV
jgi:hypothetical protein